MKHGPSSSFSNKINPILRQCRMLRSFYLFHLFIIIIIIIILDANNLKIDMDVNIVEEEI